VAAENSTARHGELVREVLGDGSIEQLVFAAMGLLRSAENTQPEISSAVIEALGVLIEKNLALREGETTLQALAMPLDLFLSRDGPNQLTGAQLDSIHGLMGALGEEAGEAFALLLEASRVELQFIGIIILEAVGSRRAAELIITKLNKSWFWFRGTRALEHIGMRAVEPLIAALGAKDENVPAIVASVLKTIGTPAVESLITGLRSQDWRVRRGAATTLGKIGDVLALEPLIALLRDGVGDVRQAAAEALGRVGNPRAIDPLVSVFADEHLYVRCTAEDALVNIGFRACGRLIAALRHRMVDVRKHAAAALGRLRDFEAVEPLIMALRDVQVRERALEALIQIGEAAIDPLVAALQNRNPDVRKLAAGALGRIGDARALGELERLAGADEGKVLLGTVAYSALEAAKSIRRRQQRETPQKRIEP
jgi:HEAT repeat protein